MKRIRSREGITNERGANLVEFALVLLLLLLLLAGVVDLGRAFHSYIVITNASREGARYGSRFPPRSPTDTARINPIKNMVIQEATGSGITLDANKIRVITDPASGAGSGNKIRVEIDYDFQPVMIGVLGVNTITMRRATEMVIFGLN